MLRGSHRFAAAVFNATIALVAATLACTAAKPVGAPDAGLIDKEIISQDGTSDGLPPPSGPTLPLVIGNGEFANLPQIFSQACKVAGGALTAGGCSFASLPNSGFGEASFLTIAESLFEAHLREQARGAAASASEISMNAIQSALKDIRDRLQRKASLGSGEAPQALGARAVQQSDGPMMGLTRTPEALPSPFAVWVQGYADREWRDSNFGFIDGRTTTTYGAIGGIDYTSYRVFSPNDAFVFGILTGITELRTDSVAGVKTNIDGPSVGLYGVYVNGGFSVDFNSKADFLALDQSSALSGLSSNLTSYATAGNVNYKFDVGGGWIEPTIGAIYTVTRWDGAMSSLDGHTVRVQGGLRLGHSFTSAGIVIEPTVAAMLYSDVVIEGGNITTVGLATPTDEGKLFELGSLKLNFDFGKGLSTSVEAEVRHGSLGHGADVVGAAGRVGLRYKW
jgi:hypothetical protein